MFSVECKKSLPVEFIEITSFSVRGALGELSVYITPVTYHGKENSPKEWSEVYHASHQPSYEEFVDLHISGPVRLAPGMSLGVYIHSRLPGDQAIVYDNKTGDVTSEDKFFKIYSGRAHLSNRPFSNNGYWGFGWRENRQYVGLIKYGVKHKLWLPSNHSEWPEKYKTGIMTILKCHNRPKDNPMLYKIPHFVLFQILNMMPYDWFGACECEDKQKKRSIFSRFANSIPSNKNLYFYIFI